LLSSHCLINGIRSIFVMLTQEISATVLILSSVQDSQHPSCWLMLLYKYLHYSVLVFHRIRHAGPLIPAAVLVMSHQ
jgi:hypothetical protein